MDPIGMFLGLAVLVAVVAIIVRPLVAGPSRENNARHGAQRSESAHRADEHAALLERRVAVYTAIHELDFEHETSKVSDEEYTRQRAELVEDGVAVLMQLDKLESAAAAADPLESAIAAKRRAMRNGEEPQVDLDAALEAGISNLRTNVTANGSHSCPTCGSSVSAHDRFCGNCGTTLESACVECNTPYQVGDLFCAHCGAALEPQG